MSVQCIISHGEIVNLGDLDPLTLPSNGWCLCRARGSVYVVWAILHWFLINMFLRVGFSRCLQALVHWCGFHADGGESEWCILLWYIAAQTVAARHLSSCRRLLLSSTPRVRKSSSHQASQQTRLQFCRLQIIESHYISNISNVFFRNSKGRQTSLMNSGYQQNDILLTEGHIIFHKVG